MTCDGPLDWINTEDVNTKMRATGWEVLDVWDGRYDVESIVAALKLANNVVTKPVFINIRTVIGVDMASAGTAKAHHGAFDEESITVSKMLAGLEPTSKHIVPEPTLHFFRERQANGKKLEFEWNEILKRYRSAFPDLYGQLTVRMSGHKDSYSSFLDDMDINQFAGMPTREVNGILLSGLWARIPSLCGGGADLVNSNKVAYSETDVFDATSGYRGRYLRNGIREHAMAAIANGMAAYNPGTFLPITATFFMFYIYVSSSCCFCILRC